MGVIEGPALHLTSVICESPFAPSTLLEIHEYIFFDADVILAGWAHYVVTVYWPLDVVSPASKLHLLCQYKGWKDSSYWSIKRTRYHWEKC